MQREPRKALPAAEAKEDGAAPPALVWSGGTVAPWRAEHAGPFFDLWRRALANVPQTVPKDRAQFDKFLASAEFDAEASAVALGPDGAILGGVLALRYPAFEDDAVASQ